MVGNMKQFDMSCKNMKTLVSEILNNNFCLCEKYENFAKIIRVA